MHKIYLTLVLGLTFSFAQAQITAPDTVCRGTVVNYTTTASAVNTFAWAPGKVDASPTNMLGSASVSLASYGKLGGICMINDNGQYYAFVTASTGPTGGKVLRLEYGNDPFGVPAVTNLGNFSGGIADSVGGIDVVSDNGNWYGFVASYRKLLRLSFGTSLTNNTPTATAMSYGVFDFLFPKQLTIFKNNGEWTGFLVNDDSTRYSGQRYPNIKRLDFGPNISTQPAVTYSVNSSLSRPRSFSMQYYKGEWFMLITNYTGPGGQNGNLGSLSLAKFGSDLKGFPTANNLGNPTVSPGPPKIFQYRRPAGLNLISNGEQCYALVFDSIGHVHQINFADSNISGTIGDKTDLGDLGVPSASVTNTSAFWYNNRLCIAGVSMDGAVYMYDNVFSLPANSKVEETNNGFANTLNDFGNYTLTLFTDQGKASGPASYTKNTYSLDAINIAIKQYDTIMVAKGAKCDLYEWRFNGVVIPNAITDTLKGMVDGGVYTVIGYKNGCSSFSTVMYHSPAGISSFNASAFISVYPNPSSGMFNIKAEGIDGNDVTINCYSLLGSLVKTVQAKTTNGDLNTSIDLAGLPKGVYQIKLQSEHGNYIKQVVLQ